MLIPELWITNDSDSFIHFSKCLQRAWRTIIIWKHHLKHNGNNNTLDSVNPHPGWIMPCFWAMEWQRTSWKDWLEGRTYSSGSAVANLAASRFLPVEQGHRNNSHSIVLCEERMRQWRWDSWLGRVLSSLHWHWAQSDCTFPNLPSNKNLMSAYKVSDCHLPSNLRANLQ